VAVRSPTTTDAPVCLGAVSAVKVPSQQSRTGTGLTASPSPSATRMVEETRLKNSTNKIGDSVVDNGRVKVFKSGRDMEDEELQYGPGIVDRLKSRYLNRTLRERQALEIAALKRPGLRRATSLENWLDQDVGLTSPNGKAVADEAAVIVRTVGDSSSNSSTSSSGNGGVVNVVRPSSLTLVQPGSSVKSYDLKKTRSVDNFAPRKSVSVSDLHFTTQIADRKKKAAAPVAPLTPVIPQGTLALVRSGGLHQVLDKQDIVIVDKVDDDRRAKVSPVVTAPAVTAAAAAAVPATPVSRGRSRAPTNSRYNVDDCELPAPDTVRQVKRIFEDGSVARGVNTNARSNSSRRSQSAGPGTNRVPLSIAADDTSRVQRLNQVNLVNGSTRSPQPTPRITDLADTKRAAVGPKPAIISPKPVAVPRSRAPSQQAPVQVVPKVSSPPPTVTVVEKPRAPVVVEAPATAVVDVKSVPAKTAVEVPAMTKVASACAPQVATSSSSSSFCSVSSSSSEDDDDDYEGPSDDDGLPSGVKLVSRTALDNIRKESTSVNFDFGDKKESLVLQKQIGVIKPQVKKTHGKVDSADTVAEAAADVAAANSTADGVTERKEKVADVCNQAAVTYPSVAKGKASKTMVTTATAPAKRSNSVQQQQQHQDCVLATTKILASANQVTKVAPAPAAATSPATNRDAKRWHQNQETSKVFNFTNVSKDTSHIKNEGPSFGNEIYKKNDPGIVILKQDCGNDESSDFIEDLDVFKRPPSPCNVIFEGANIVLEGKSSLRRRNKTRKANISFNDGMTTLFEYPSESSLLQEETNDFAKSQDHDKIAPPLGSGRLADYTPSKVLTETPPELGVDPLVSPQALLALPVPTIAEEDYLKPAEMSTTWSAETTADMLF